MRNPIHLRNYLSRRPLAAYVVLAFVFSWLLWWVAELGEKPALFFDWLGGFGPAVAAILLTGLLEGREALGALLRRIFTWRVHPRLYLAAVTLPLIGTLLLMALYGLINGKGEAFKMIGPWLATLARTSPVLLMSLLLGWIVVTGEEIGWRGYLLPQLRARHSDLVASLMVGLVWGLWHLPELWPFKAGSAPITLLFFMADIVIISVLYTWLHANSRGSILLVSLFHGVYDLMVMYASASLPFIRETRGLETIILLGMAVVVVVIYGRQRFERCAQARSIPERGPLDAGP
jgi:membrane protease YdiL (CAAX protease family)